MIEEFNYPEGSFEATFSRIYNEAFDLLVERQKKYGPRNIAEQGIYGVYQRIANDKISRLGMSINGKIENGKLIIEISDESGDESFEDSLLDIANYALIMLALKRGEWGHPLAAKMAQLFPCQNCAALVAAGSVHTC